jgi:uroporphyrinogen decarboxylase
MEALLLRALKRQPVERTPLWIMRQAGRYLPEYRALRARAGSFLTLCKTPELACQVTLQPLERFPLDAAILFSDILMIPDAMGLQLHFVEQEGPVFAQPIRDAKAIDRLPLIDPEADLAYVLETIRLIKAKLNSKTPLIGFAGSPWTVATYMVEGGSSKHFSRIKRLRYAEAPQLHRLLQKLTENTSRYLLAQVAAGADVIMLFDTWGAVLAESDYTPFSLSYLSRIVMALKSQYPEVPVIIFTKNGGRHLAALADTGADALGLDEGADLHLARQTVGQRVALQGNLDPAALYANEQQIKRLVEKTLTDFGMGTGHIFNLGHGIYPDTKPEHVPALVEAVYTLSPRFHSASRASVV